MNGVRRNTGDPEEKSVTSKSLGPVHENPAVGPEVGDGAVLLFPKTEQQGWTEDPLREEEKSG